MRKKAYSYSRFSRPEQALGDSLRRQTQAAKEWAEKNGYYLDTTLRADEGISAFDGSNRSKGEFGLFLKMVDEGVVENGSVLIVESLDRISREDLFSALQVFSSIIEKGVKIVTTCDGREYDKNSIRENPFDLFASLMVLHRANEESAMKSQRISKAWKEKRKKAEEVKLSAQCPEWLRLSDDRKKFIPLPERIQILQKIFQWAKDGHGQGSIAKRLNEEGVEPWGRGKRKGTGWHSSYIHKILRNRAVIGEFEPHTVKKGEARKPTGEVLDNYFPKVIEESLFYEVRNLRVRRSPGGSCVSSNRKGKVSNLFTGIARCGYCGSSMRFVSKGKPPSHGTYLVCSKAIMGNGCKYLSTSYSEFEHTILRALRELDWNEIINPERGSNLEKSLREKLATTIAKREDITPKIERLVSAIENATADSPSAILKRIEELQQEGAELDEEISDVETDIAGLGNSAESISSISDHLDKALEKMNSLEAKELFDFRTSLRQRILDLIEGVRIFPRNPAIHREQIEALDSQTGADLPPSVHLIQLLLSDEDGRWRKSPVNRLLVSEITLKGGDKRLVFRSNGIISTVSNFEEEKDRIPFFNRPSYDVGG